MTVNYHQGLTPRAIPAAPASRANSAAQRKPIGHIDAAATTAKARSKLKPGLMIAATAAAIVATGLAACSTNKSDTGTTSPTAATSTTTAAAATGNPRTTSSATATAGVNFVGGWHVHGSNLTITPTTATLVTSMGPCGNPGSQRFCSETDAMGVVSGDDKQLTLVATGVTFTDHTGGSVPNPNPGPSTAVGDTMQLAWQAPGLLKTTALHGFPGFSGGNPYWCGAGISQGNRQLCGA
jgi:hypothetical protein